MRTSMKQSKYTKVSMLIPAITINISVDFIVCVLIA